MAMIKCSECGKDVSDRAGACPHCGNPIAGAPTASHGQSPQGVPAHLTRQALRTKFSPITEEVPQEIRGHVGAGEDVLYFNYIDKKGGCLSGKGSKQWIMITNARVAYRATLEQKAGPTTSFVESSGSILLPQISYVGMTKGQSAGCTVAALYQLKINSSGGTISIAMPTEGHCVQARQFIEAVLNPQ